MLIFENMLQYLSLIFKRGEFAMVKIFAKVIIEEKVRKTFKYEVDEDFEIDHFFDYVKDICEHFDSPTPVILTKHIRDFIVFSTTSFQKEDFIENIFFDKLTLETFKGL